MKNWESSCFLIKRVPRTLDLAGTLGAKRPVNVALTGCAVYIDQRKRGFASNGILY